MDVSSRLSKVMKERLPMTCGLKVRILAGRPGRNCMLIIPSLFLLCCGHLPGDTLYNADKPLDEHSISYFEFTEGPMALLKTLKSKQIVFLDGDAPPNWIKIDDVKKLMKLIRSDDKCGITCSTFSSSIPHGESTVGREALFLIEGFRAGKYPPALTSNQCKLSVKDAEDWYKRAYHDESKGQ